MYPGSRHPRFPGAAIPEKLPACLAVVRLSYVTVTNYRIVRGTRRNRVRIVRNRRMPFCGHRAGHFLAWLGLALGPSPARRFPAGSLQVLGALKA